MFTELIEIELFYGLNPHKCQSGLSGREYSVEQPQHVLSYGGYPEMAQKVIEGDVDT